MLNLEPEEKILLILHHHWIAFLGPLLIVMALFLAPLFLIPTVTLANTPALLPLIMFLICVWYMAILFLALGFWIDYYLDALVITSKRILNVSQSGLFRHTVSEFKLERVQDVTIEVPNFLATFLRFGNIKIHTAGDISFSITEVPSPHDARDIILKHSKGGG